ncbi:TPA: GFA family protein [Acinetobacter baumannii]|nr:GFA family protein [Acinetobacter baumannii]
MTEKNYHGSCLCGEIEYEIKGGLGEIIQCHCQKCRKASGTSFATNALVKQQFFTLTKGIDKLKSFASSEVAKRFFCNECGSPVYSVKSTAPDIYRVRIGLINEDISEPLAKHAFVGSKANWDEIRDNLPQFTAYPN